MIRLTIQCLVVIGLFFAVVWSGTSVWNRLSKSSKTSPAFVVQDNAVTGEGQDRNGMTVVKLPPLNVYRETLTRPLFFANRRFSAPKPKKVEVAKAIKKTTKKAAKQPTLQLQLHGVFLNGHQQKALISIQNRVPSWVMLNDKVSGWTVAEIRGDHVKLTSKDKERRLNLYRDKTHN